MSLETELKLLLEGERRVRAADLFKALGQEAHPRGRRLHLVSTYHDTPARELAERGMSLRIRRAGRGRVQTLKVAANGAAGLGNFLEFEAPVRVDAPRIDLIKDPEVRRKLSRSGLWSRLKPAFRTDFDRVSWLVPFGTSTIEISWDRGRIIAGRKSEAINELELELKSGAPVDLFAAAEALLDTVPYRLGTRTKAARGISLLKGEQVIPVKSRPAPLTSEDTIAVAFEKIVISCLAQMSANEAAILETADPEAIHQFRVALRRFRAILAPFRELIDDGAHAVWAIDLRWAQRQFGPARDLDVFVAETGQPMLRHLSEDKALVQLLALAEGHREEARRRALQALHNPRYASMQIQILACLANGRWRHPEKAAILDQPIQGFADRLLQTYHKRVRRLGRNWRDLADADLHRLRILVKKLRYGVGFFQPLYAGKRVKSYAGALAALQDCLGGVNDAVVGRQIMREVLAAAGELDPSAGIDHSELDRAFGLVVGWQMRGIEAERQSLAQLWPAFSVARKFWRRPRE